METDIKQIREMSKAIARAVPIEDTGLCGIVIHPFITNTTAYIGGKFLNLFDDNNMELMFTEFDTIIDSCDLPGLYMQWRDPWKLTFMKYCGDYLSEKDFAHLLAESWVTEENPNMDVNVSRKEVLKMFKKCKKEYLMDEKDLDYYNNLPEKVTLYRGVSKGRIPLGLSWTDDKATAEWFMNRWQDKDNCLLKVVADKKDIIAYFNTRDEKECVLDVFKYSKKISNIDF